jgi:hypothetical protein
MKLDVGIYQKTATLSRSAVLFLAQWSEKNTSIHGDLPLDF